MRKLIVSIFIFIVLIFSFIIINCQKSRYEYFIVQIDSLYSQSPIPCDDTLYINLYGLFVGRDVYPSFSHFEAKRDSFELNLTVWGKRNLKSPFFPIVIIPFDTFYSVYPLYPGSFYIEIEQPNDSSLKDTVIVE